MSSQRHRSLSEFLPTSLDERVRSRFDSILVTECDGCLIIDNRSCKSNGYPRHRGLRHGRMTPVQRDVYESANGSIPKDKVVVRTCGNKACANIDHLVLRDRKTTQELMKQRRDDELKAKRKEKRRTRNKLKKVS